MRCVLERRPVAAPAVGGVQAFPILTERTQFLDVISQPCLAIKAFAEEVQIDRQTLQMLAAHRLAAAVLYMQGLLLGGPVQLATRYLETKLISLVQQLDDMLQEDRLFAQQAHDWPPTLLAPAA